MLLKKWDSLPETMQLQEVKQYYESLQNKSFSLICKRLFDIVASLLLLVLCSPLFAVFAVWIKIDSKGPVFYRQERVTQNGKIFRIYKFRSMVQNADKMGELVTCSDDARITRSGRKLRNSKLDELGQLINILKGEMSFVGIRPEVKKYVDCYTPEMMATLLLPAGITSITSVYYKDEEQLLSKATDRDTAYRTEVLPAKMYYNLKGIMNFSFKNDIKVLFMTFFAVIRHKDYKPSADDLVLQEQWCKKTRKMISENEKH